MKPKKLLAVLLSILLICGTVLAGCSAGGPKFGKIDNTKWKYNELSDSYYQTELVYCKKPTDTAIQSLAVFVPAKYVNPVANGNGTYTLTINEYSTIDSYIPSTAPIIFSIENSRYTKATAPTGYINKSVEYTQKGYIYVTAGCRGDDAGAPWGVTDLKAAIRYLRYIKDDIPGDTEKIYATGKGGAGGLATVLGTSGDSPIYDKYLKKIGAVTKTSDAIYGVSCWSPNTSFDTADSAYEWNMGVTRTKMSSEEKEISSALTAEYAKYINALKLKDGKTALSLNDDNKSGTYTDYLKSVIEQSLNSFLKSTTFPYTADSISDGDSSDTTEKQSDSQSTTDKNGAIVLPDLPLDENDKSVAGDGIIRNKSASALDINGTYNTAEDYIKALNKNTKWVSYDKKSNTAKITSVDDFVKQMKGVTRGIGAFDALNKKQAENILFSTDGKGAHFDSILYKAVKNNSKYVADFKADLDKKDSIGTTTEQRVDMYNPLYYISSYYDGNGTSKVAKQWRIRSGISQGDTALCTEVNLALALKNTGATVDFEENWGIGNVLYEYGDSPALSNADWISQNK